MKLTHPIRLSCLTLLASAASAQTIEVGLTPDSNLITGCYPPCLCPIVLEGQVSGTMKLIFTEPLSVGWLGSRRL